MSLKVPKSGLLQQKRQISWLTYRQGFNRGTFVKPLGSTISQQQKQKILEESYQQSEDHPEEMLNEGLHENLHKFNHKRENGKPKSAASSKPIDLWAMCIHGKGAKISYRSKQQNS
eukprot:TRINITY_DN15101_c0_g1_i1.p3 TRINITY_DN15101_c0_g1~~TRINITY_DN15101_c0_g1_i1.p3  ORF type:complete len:116 (-),score=8.16 TRINITY_DN15101_c0_g1_i1:402-749(-)